ncbi:bifunctional precorrin-2 dehydrogenase/sirohydrochlorin ferrochelatase [Paenibacillus sp. P25]|nr:bifunctional precorrin-2 dehydrogenase/sirohydrochlorin ferrochelatase [Paenibacillus sp. P25]
MSERQTNGVKLKYKRYYPVLLDLEGKPCLVVGGGTVAERKVRSLLEAGADVTVVSPELTERLESWTESGRLQVRRIEYTAGLPELAATWLVYAATDSPEVNAMVRQEAEALRKPVNAADNGEEGGFLVPAIVRRGRLTVSVSTGGASPGLAARLRDQLEAAFGEEYEAYLDLLYILRKTIQAAVPDPKDRQESMRIILEWDLLSVIRGSCWNAGLEQELLRRIETDPTPEGIRSSGGWLRQFFDPIGP